jgi:putative ABC transport system permease protein
LKGKFASRSEGAWLRNGLVVFQFAITVGLILGTVVIYNQLQYIQNKKMGYDKEHLLILNDAYGLGDNLDAFRQEMGKHPQVINATVTSYLPTPSNRNTNGHFLGRNPNPEDTQVLQSWWVDHDYIKTMDMKIVEGRDFSREFPGDSSAVIINEAAVKIFNLDEPLGKEISTVDGEADGKLQFTPYRVIGVVKNFHFESVRQAIQPLIMYLGRSRDFIAFRIKGDDIPGFINTLQSRWNEMAPNQPFDYNFLDDRFDAMYESETRIGHIISVFTMLAIVIACLGLFGLATFTAEQRTKEIGIRKVLGAPMSRLYILMTTDFTRWVLLASAIALPLAYLGMSRWLEGFVYRTSISAGSLILAVGIALIIALVTVSYQALRVARVNPVKTLKYE